jgi:hypothetical protein
MTSMTKRLFRRGVTLVVAGFLLASCAPQPSQNEVRLKQEVDSLRVALSEVQAERRDCGSYTRPIAIRQSAVEALRRKGLQDPLLTLSNDLRHHPELLPQDSRCELGGAFFYYPECMYLLAGNWVMAYFEDGLCSGHILLEFSVGDSGAIAWKPVAWTQE